MSLPNPSSSRLPVPARAPRLAHLGIAVAAYPEALRFWRDLLGLPLEHEEHVPGDGVSVAMLRLGDVRLGEAGPGEMRPGEERQGEGTPVIELLRPDAGDNPVARFLAKRGPGLHHVALRVDDLPGLHARLVAAGVRLIDAEPRPGAHGTTVCFVHPAATGGVLVELVAARAGS